MNADQILYQVERWQTSQSLKPLRCKVEQCRSLLSARVANQIKVILICPTCGKKYKVPYFVLEVYWAEIDFFQRMLDEEGRREA